MPVRISRGHLRHCLAAGALTAALGIGAVPFVHFDAAPAFARGPDSLADLADQRERRRRQYFGNADGRGQARRQCAAAAARHAVRRSLRRIFQAPSAAGPGRYAASAAAPIEFARLGLRHRFIRHRDHQQSRHLRRQRSDGHLHRRTEAEGRDRRQGHEGRRSGAARQTRQAAEGGEIRRQRQDRASAIGSWPSAIRSASAAR